MKKELIIAALSMIGMSIGMSNFDCCGGNVSSECCDLASCCSMIQSTDITDCCSSMCCVK